MKVSALKNTIRRRKAMGKNVVNNVAKMIARVVITDAKLNANAASSVGMYQPAYPKSMALLKRGKKDVR